MQLSRGQGVPGRRHYIEMVFALIVLAMAELATVAWGQQPVRELQTLEQAPIAGESNASSAPEGVAAVCQRVRAQAEAEIAAAPATKKRAGDIAECQCFGGIPVVVAGVLNSRGIACAQPLGD